MYETATRRRLRGLVRELERAGVQFERTGETVAVKGIEREPWLRCWLDRHRVDLCRIIRPAPPPCPEIDPLQHSFDLAGLLSADVWGVRGAAEN